MGKTRITSWVNKLKEYYKSNADGVSERVVTLFEEFTKPERIAHEYSHKIKNAIVACPNDVFYLRQLADLHRQYKKL